MIHLRIGNVGALYIYVKFDISLKGPYSSKLRFINLNFTILKTGEILENFVPINALKLYEEFAKLCFAEYSNTYYGDL